MEEINDEIKIKSVNNLDREYNNRYPAVTKIRRNNMKVIEPVKGN